MCQIAIFKVKNIFFYFSFFTKNSLVSFIISQTKIQTNGFSK